MKQEAESHATEESKYAHRRRNYIRKGVEDRKGEIRRESEI